MSVARTTLMQVVLGCLSFI